MVVILFVFGLPGSGKSAAARQIWSFARHKKFRPRRFRDYILLNRMFKKDQEVNNDEKRFRSTKEYTKYDGFDILDFSVLDEVLQKLHRNIIRRKKLVDDTIELLIIEFSRIDYCKALSFFPSLPLKDAYFLFIYSKISVCKERIKARAVHPKTLDDRYVSDYSFDKYYKKDQQQSITEIALQLNQQFGVPIEHVQNIYNGTEISVELFNQSVESFANDLLMIKV
jgi:adenylate kinase family enzyme